MPSRIDWPSNDEIARELPTFPTVQAYADHLGVNATALREKLKRAKISAAPTLRKVARNAPDPGVLQENRELRKQVREASSEDARERRVIAAIEAAVAVREPIYRPPASRARKPSKTPDHEFVLLWSDAHAGEVVDPAAMSGMNAYDWGVMMDRHRALAEAVLSYKEHQTSPIDRLHVCALGDMLSGNIHESLRETNQMPLAEATVQFGLDGADWLENLASNFKRTTFRGVVGNHPRESMKPATKRKFSNADWTCYQVMRQRLKRSPVEFEIPKSSRLAFNVYATRFLMYHGDAVGPSSMVGVPWGGIIRHVARLRNQFADSGEAISHFVCGHFHEANAVQNRKIIVNGSIIGPNEYSLEKFGECSGPTQLLLTVNKRHGLVDVSYIDL